uniref:Zinc finger protein on ecdysone puffs n=2 Tax=Cacopsylla melanoneura TaxID=428564 RepID=A0A8D8VSI7_9HEMI
MSYNRNRGNNQGKWGGQNNYGGNNMGSVNPWDSGSNMNPGANVLNSLVGNAPDAVQQLLAASKILSNVLAPQQNLLPNPQVSMMNQGGYGGNRGMGNYNDRFNRGGNQQRDNWGGQNRHRNDSGNYRNNNRGNLNQNQNQQRNKSHVSSSSSSLASSQKKETKVFKKEESNKDETASADKEDPKAKDVNRYADIPKALLYCHVCRKYMWDDVSFDNHVKGRNHKLMLEELDKLYKMQCEIMRQEFRMSEQQHGWYYDKAQRMGKKVKKAMEYCTMCDLNYHGTRGFHRKSTKHQELKHFLHPKCNICNLEFPTRLEWDEHILLPVHLKNMAVRRAELKPDLKDDDFDFDDFLYVSDLSDYLASDLKPASSILTDVTPVGAEKDEKEDEDEKEEGDDDEKKEKRDKKEKVDESSIVFYNDDESVTENYLDEIRNLSEDDYTKKVFVRYNTSIPAGTEFVVQSAGHLCRICNLFVGTRDEALKHCKAYAHHISLVNVLAKVNQARKTVRKRSYKDGKDEEDVEMKDAAAGGEEGNWKRRKVVAKEDNGTVGAGNEKKMEVDAEEEEEEVEEVNGQGEEEKEEQSGGEEEVKAEVEDEEVDEQEEPSPPTPPPAKTPARGTPRARRGRGIKK